MKYNVSNNHGHIPWIQLTAENSADIKKLIQLEKELIANKARFNSQEFEGKLQDISLHLQEN